MTNRLTDAKLQMLRDFFEGEQIMASNAVVRGNAVAARSVCDELIKRRAADAQPAPDVNADTPGDAMTDWLCDLAEQTNATHTRGVDAKLLKMQREGE